MLSTKFLLLGASLFTYAVAQTRIAFTSVPAVANAGESYNITWGGGDGSPVTITLREGNSNDLKTVATLADGVDEDFFVWNVSKSLPTASDYALQITQGQDSINYSGQFSIVGGSGTSSISVTGASTTTAATNATAPLTTTHATIISAGTSTLMASNGTFSSATLSRTTSTSLDPAVTEHMTSSASASSSFNFGDQPSSTSAAQTNTATTSVPDSAGAPQLGSSAALVMGVFAAVVFLN
ncbi:hypothetical protein A1O7_07423 [Cladophialophora yegresii CBS 114405]|uniref:Yeast cell wall synthesis Kre9/Knh1-like N-terminal domain-containing protein n=1 Tax=Cladophialophora yegresii CBS 114405 TaxID=1182544 RepID=W9WEX8_9EURO|nr:uncharacterized protein A1O7_07423 [Cladophialophora yegresii CBS 114405]EXJ57079.1 hypothetical protein A1O7_07423 [Cladophialophora yegresii CBS 114405]